MPDQQEAVPFGGLAVQHHTIVMLWELDRKTGKPIRPAVIFTPTFPGDGFNHTILLRLGGMGDKHSFPCPCGVAVGFQVEREAKGSDAYTVEKCPQCGSWHSVRWQMPPEQPRKKSGFILC